MEISYDQPKHDEIEISCFGPGFGESIVIHPGNGEWIIIDSCITYNDSLPASINYLKSIKVKPETQVRIVLATHWHDDHIKGIAETFDNCKSAIFYCSDALRTNEFRDLIVTYGSSPLLEESGVSELYKVMKILQSRDTNKNPKFASENKRIWYQSQSESPFHKNLELWTLSPSDAAKLLSIRSIGNLLPKEYVKYYTKRRIPDPKQNDVAVVLWLAVGELHFLFGSDLENNSNEEIGWKALLNNQMRPKGKALFYKIAHHGAESSHHNNIWKDLLENKPYACLTPLQLGKNQIPTKHDVERIITLTQNAYSTASFQKSKRIKRQAAVDKTIENATTKPLEILFSSKGHFRFRINANKPYEGKIDLFHGAIKLEEIYNS